ncbi:FecR family protein [Sphingopyxis fribergensis]
MTAGSPADIDARAALYVARMDGDEWSDEKEQELEIWLALDPKHPGALLRAQAAWMTLDRPFQALPMSNNDVGSTHWVGRRGFLAGGAAAVAASIIGGILLSDGASYATDVGEIRRIPLADGSIAAINTASSIEVDLDEQVRKVRIDQGEAWFQVAKDKSRPFIVAAGRVRVRAVGTAFSVRRRSGGADVLVTEGEVELWADGAEGHRVRLKAGSRGFVADNAAIAQESATPSAIDRMLAWRNGKVDLNGDRLDSAAAEFNRYNRRQLVIVDQVIAGELFDGVFRTDDPEGFAQAVTASLGVPIDLSDPARIEIGRRNKK